MFGTNDAPVANADTNWVKEDTNLTASGNVLTDAAHAGAPSGSFADVADTDVDVEGLTVTAVNGDAGNVGTAINGSYGILTLNANGTYSYTLYTAAQNLAAYNAVQARDTEDAPLTETFNYTASDGTATASSSLTLSVFGTNDAPVANADTNWVKEDTNLTASGNVLTDAAHAGAPSGSFADVADTDVDVEGLTVTAVNGDAGNVGTAINGSYGILTLNANGTYSYTLYTAAQNLAAYNAVQARDTEDAPLTETFNYGLGRDGDGLVEPDAVGVRDE
ncbi:MAG: hypothetical protein IPM06_04430 [Rhizobiales bacterium]|nr:hypothetical protein [Hyphomicrobiales bacterium]